MKILKKVSDKLRYLGYSEKTIETYVCYIGKFFEDENIRDPHQVRTSQIIIYLESKEYTSVSQQQRNKEVIDFLDKFKSNILRGKINIDELNLNFGHCINGDVKILNGFNNFTVKYNQI